MSGFDNETVYATNWDFRGVQPVIPQVTLSGQLPIGTGGSPAILAGVISSPDSTVSIGYSSPNITMTVNGSLIPGTITGDTGGAISQSGHNWNIISNVAANAAGHTVSFSGSGSTLTLNTTDATFNTIIGLQAGAALGSGLSARDTFLGYRAGTALATGGSTGNTLIGSEVMLNSVQAQNNTCVGLQCASSLSGANAKENTILGNSAGNSIVNAQRNVLIGSGCGTSLTGTDSSNIMIVNTGTAGDNNTIRLGVQGSGINQQSKCFIAGITGVTVSNQQLVTINFSTGQLGVTTIPILSSNIVSTNQTGTTNNSYTCISPGGALTISLPTTSAAGDLFEVILDGATSWQITQAASQQIRFGSSTTTLEATGTLTTTAQGDAITLRCKVANTLWTAISFIGNLTPA